ncbi:hypothetical protein M758_UG167400 [Ceratodon purpureus]|uniref:Uncharacterized protein n=1 Tax=Ceratodon purpureus TaxID=3225 RepID=A0A8T0GEE8_CERPU|nr:hypothetical protein KC19_11G100100 [Ceratodon purpureus]KAG0595451.1 hypothetical protein M758_UG167400 [Ceratodon purpureus]
MHTKHRHTRHHFVLLFPIISNALFNTHLVLSHHDFVSARKTNRREPIPVGLNTLQN